MYDNLELVAKMKEAFNNGCYLKEGIVYAACIDIMTNLQNNGAEKKKLLHSPWKEKKNLWTLQKRKNNPNVHKITNTLTLKQLVMS